MGRVSFSQYSMWSTCPNQYKLAYIDDLSESSSNIHSVFGSAMHETLQQYLDICLRVSKSQADKTFFPKEVLKNKMREIYLKESDGGKNQVCSKEELVEFLEDGNLIIDHFQKSKNFNKFFTLKEEEIIAIEQPINTKINENVNFLGFIDLVVKNNYTNRYRIIDFKTSTKGWSDYQKKDPVKNAQILLYKKFYAELLTIPEDQIDVEFIILKRKINENVEYPPPRISKHIPANGKPSVNKAWISFKSFVDEVFDTDGNHKRNIPYPKKPSKLCEWCEFYGKHCDGK